MEINAQVLNESFLKKLDSKEGLEKVAQESSAFIRTKLREVSFARKIVQPQYVTKADLQRSVNHDGMVKIVDIEPDSKAMVVNFLGNPDTTYIRGERFEIPFYTVSSDDFQKTEEELLAYNMPLTEVIEKNSVLDIQKVEDEQFLNTVDAAIAIEVGLGNDTDITGNYDTDGSIKKSDLVALFDLLDGNRLRAEVLLMDNKMFNKLLLWNATTMGDQVSSETIVNGYSYSALLGRRIVVSNKTDLLAGKIYAFTSQDFFGQFLILNDTKFWIDKKKNIITFAAYENIGMGIGNTKACAKLTLSA